jgi:Leucine-rich repeat (LRR) protein
MMLYHPDRGNYHRSIIDKMAEANDFDGLLGYAHILQLGKIEEIAQTLSSYEDIDYSPVYEWDINLDGFTIVGGHKTNPGGTEEPPPKKSRGISFYDAVKIRMFGNTKTTFPTHYLEDLEEIELAQSDIIDLDGIQYCIHTTSIDVSGNRITDLSLMWGLKLLEEINLSDNRIEEIETLSNLKNLRTVFLNNNPIRDISSLMGLGKLEYLEISGCRIPTAQIQELEDSGVTVVGM